MEQMTLLEFVIWVVSGGGAGVFSYFLMEKVQFLANLASEVKRYVGIGLTSLIALAFWAGGIGLGYFEQPAGWQAWLEGAFAIAWAANTVALVIHGRTKLRLRDMRA